MLVRAQQRHRPRAFVAAIERPTVVPGALRQVDRLRPVRLQVEQDLVSDDGAGRRAQLEDPAEVDVLVLFQHADRRADQLRAGARIARQQPLARVVRLLELRPAMLVLALAPDGLDERHRRCRSNRR